MKKDENKEEIKNVVKSIKKQFGNESIMILGNEPIQKIKTVSTGSLLLDQGLGIGGLPRGRIIEIYGPESSGKTTLALHVISEIQKNGGVAAFIDAENAIDLTYAKALGVDVEQLLLSQPDSGEQALEICDNLVRSNAIDVIVVDSVAALVPEVELNGEMSDQTIGAQARLMSKALRKMTGAINSADAVVIFINQLREKVGVIYGSPEVTSGGRALKFYSSIRIDIRKFDVIKNGSELVGIRSRAKIVKNKVAPPFKVVELDILYGQGISKTSEIIDLAATLEIIEKSGSWYAYNGEKIGQGRENAKLYLTSNEKLLTEITNKLIDKLNNKEK
jgi:recombination protein RecA